MVHGRRGPTRTTPSSTTTLPTLFTSRGIPVLTVDSLPGMRRGGPAPKPGWTSSTTSTPACSPPPSWPRATPALEYVQIVSFGCGHDAYLSDEIIRLHAGRSRGKTPLVLKLDESDVQGPLRHPGALLCGDPERRAAAPRRRRRRLGPAPLPDPYPVKFTARGPAGAGGAGAQHLPRLLPAHGGGHGRRGRADRSPCRWAGEEAIRLRQAATSTTTSASPPRWSSARRLSRSEQRQATTWTTWPSAMAKYMGDCRLTHYGALLRKALDDAGFAAGARSSPTTTRTATTSTRASALRLAAADARLPSRLPMIDVLEELLRQDPPLRAVYGRCRPRPSSRRMDALHHGLDAGRARCGGGLPPGASRPWRRCAVRPLPPAAHACSSWASTC